MTKVRKLMHRKSLKGCGLVSLTHFRYKCRSIGMQGMSGTLTPKIQEINAGSQVQKLITYFKDKHRIAITSIIAGKVTAVSAE